MHLQETVLVGAAEAPPEVCPHGTRSFYPSLRIEPCLASTWHTLNEGWHTTQFRAARTISGGPH